MHRRAATLTGTRSTCFSMHAFMYTTCWHLLGAESFYLGRFPLQERGMKEKKNTQRRKNQIKESEVVVCAFVLFGLRFVSPTLNGPSNRK